MARCIGLRKLLLLTLQLIIISTQLSISEVRYVSKTGSSTPPYTSWATASDSIQKCINISNFGDTIYVANGVYKEKVILKPGLSLIGGGMDSCIVDTRSFQITSPFQSILVSDSCYVYGVKTITFYESGQPQGRGFFLKGTSSKVEFVKTTIAADGFKVDKNNIVSNNFILDCEDGITNSSSTSTISNNLIYPISQGLVSQIFSSPTYLNNTIIFNDRLGAGFVDYGDLSTLKNNLFICYQDAREGFFSYGDIIINNILIGDWKYGAWTSSSIIKNNHFENTKKAIAYDNFGTLQPPLVKHNNLWNNGVNFVNFSGDSTNTFNYPMFVNEDSLDFHLQKNSPLIDAGDPDILDKDGTRSDIGLYGGPFGESYPYINLAPSVPKNLTANFSFNILTMKWKKNHESDFSHYNLYKDTTKNFTIDTTKLIVSSSDTSYAEVIQSSKTNLYYKLTAVDSAGNESEESEEIAVILVSTSEELIVVEDYQLYQNYPNPFNSSTVISYKLKESGYVKMYVYDIKGELMKVLINEVQERGYYEVRFDADKTMPSGLYVYQLMVIGENRIPEYQEMKKMMYIK